MTGVIQIHYLDVKSSFVIRCVVNAASQDFKARIMNSHLLYREMLRISFFLLSRLIKTGADLVILPILRGSEGTLHLNFTKNKDFALNFSNSRSTDVFAELFNPDHHSIHITECSCLNQFHIL